MTTFERSRSVLDVESSIDGITSYWTQMGMLRECATRGAGCLGSAALCGVASGVLHLLETAPSEGWQDDLEAAGKPWFERLAIRWRKYPDDQGRGGD
jgi:hypothetical protein